MSEIVNRTILKTAIALGVAALAATASAQEGVKINDNFTLFGVAEAQVGTWRGVGEATANAANPFGAKLDASQSTGMIPVGINASRFGLRGQADLDDGLSVNFVFENQINLGNGSAPARLFHRQANVGLTSTSWGQLRAGRVYSPWNDVASNSAVGYGDAYDPYVRVWRVAGPAPLGTSTANGLGAAVGVDNTVGSAQLWTHVRMDNSIRYDSPKLADAVTLSAHIAMNDPTQSGVSASSVGAVYDKGPLRVGFGYYTQNTRSFFDYATNKVSTTNSQTGKLNTATLALNYDFGPAKLWSMVSRSDYDMFTLQATPKRIGSNEFSLGVSVPMNKWLFKASIAGSDSSELSGSDSGAAVEVHYNLPKNTVVYSAYSYSQYGELLYGQSDQSSNIFAIGVRKLF